MSMDLFDGIHEWSSNEITAKDEAVKAREEIFSAEIDLLDTETSFVMLAINQILAWTDFPYQQRAYLDCLIGVAASETSQFTATGIEIARQLRTGKNSRDASLAKWVTRQKKKFQEWQSRRQFNLVEITDGWFDAKRQKNTPSSYKINIVEWAKRAVAYAKAKLPIAWRNGARYRKVQIRAIRRAVYDLLQSMPECPPLSLKNRTLSVEDNFDRRTHSVVSFVEKNIHDLYRVGIDHIEYVDYVIHELQKLREKPAGAIGNILTPAEKEPDKKAKVWQATLRGKLSNLMNGEGVIDYTGMNVDNTDHRMDIDADSESDNFAESTFTARNSLTPLSVGGTFSDIQDTSVRRDQSFSETIDQSENTPPGFAPAEDDSEGNMNLKKVQQMVGIWRAQIDNRVPVPNRTQKIEGAWEISWHDVTSIARQTEGALDFAILKTAYDRISLEKLKPVFVEYVMARVRYWRGNIPIVRDDAQLERFKDKLTEFLEIPDLTTL